MNTLTPAQVYALVFGTTLLLVGVAGFFVSSSFDTGGAVQGDELIAFEVNGWHNIVHIASGLLGLALWRSVAGARSFALGFGAVYAVVAVWGFVDGSDILGLIPVNTADNWLHVAIAAAGIAAGLAPTPDRGPAAGRTRTA